MLRRSTDPDHTAAVILAMRQLARATKVMDDRSARLVLALHELEIRDVIAERRRLMRHHA